MRSLEEWEMERAVDVGVDHNLEVQNSDLAVLRYHKVLAWLESIEKTA